MEVVPLNAREPGEIERTIASIAHTPNSGLIVTGRLKHGLATVSATRESAVAGILLTYGPSIIQAHKRAAIYVDKILKGAKPSDLPVEQPIKFELAINLKTARALDLAVPPSLFIRADEVIE